MACCVEYRSAELCFPLCTSSRNTHLQHLPTCRLLALHVAALPQITCIAEVPAFQLQDRLLDRWGVTAVLDLVQAVYALRLALYALLPFAGPICIYLVLPVEVLHGITFACGWGAGTVNCKQLAPAGLAATLQVRVVTGRAARILATAPFPAPKEITALQSPS